MCNKIKVLLRFSSFNKRVHLSMGVNELNDSLKILFEFELYELEPNSSLVLGSFIKRARVRTLSVELD